jgi:hypothetical protein
MVSGGSGWQSPELRRDGQTVIFTIRARRHPLMLLFAVIWLGVCTSILFTMVRAMPAAAAFPLVMMCIFALVFVPQMWGRELIELTPAVVRFLFIAGPYKRQLERPTATLRGVREIGRPGGSWYRRVYTRKQALVPAPSLAFDFDGEVVRCGDGLSEEDAPEVLATIPKWVAERRRFAG